MFQFPQTRFVEETTPEQQRQHILSEVMEFSEAATQYGHLSSRAIEEAFDVIQSIETYLRKYTDKSYLAAARIKVIEKNDHRGYYK